MGIEYVSALKKESDTVELYKALEWYNLKGYTDEDINKANESFYSVYAYDGDTLVGLGRVASDGIIAAIMSGICVRHDYRRQGIGAEIVNRLVEYCQSGIYNMNVQLFCEDSLIHWYEALGFEKVPMGMRKNMPHIEEKCALKKHFGEIYGVDQIAEISPDFYWYNFDWFGEFSYYAGIGSEGVKVPFISMTLYSNEPVKFSADVIFENVSEFEIGCVGLRTPLFGFDIVNTEKYGYSKRKQYRIRSLEDDHIGFFCETFRIISIHVSESARISSVKPAAADEDSSYENRELPDISELAQKASELVTEYTLDDEEQGISAGMREKEFVSSLDLLEDYRINDLHNNG